jgi:hypothetical protein
MSPAETIHSTDRDAILDAVFDEMVDATVDSMRRYIAR